MFVDTVTLDDGGVRDLGRKFELETDDEAFQRLIEAGTIIQIVNAI